MNSNNTFKAFNDLKVMVIGDVMIDQYLEGKVTRISPEAPVPIVHLSNSDNRLGGAANVALNVQSLGAKAYLFGVIGEDENTSTFYNLLKDNDLDKLGIVRSPHRCTTVKTRVIASQQQMLRVDKEDTHDLSDEELENLLEKIKSFIAQNKVDVIILQDYNKGVFSKKTIESILALAKNNNIKTIVDPKRNHFFAYQNVDIFKPNLKEIQDALKQSIQPSLSSLIQAGDLLLAKTKAKNIMITLSQHGIFIYDGKNANIIPTQVRKIADVCGAGDSVVSIAALGLALDLDLNDIAVLSNLAGGQVCEKVGVVTIDKFQLKEEYEQLV